MQQLTAIGQHLNKIERGTVKKTAGPHKSSSRSTGAKHKVLNKSDSTRTNTHSARMHTNVTGIHAVPSIFLLPTFYHFKVDDSIQANENIQKIVDERLSELEHLNPTVVSQKFKSQRGGVEVFVKQKGRCPQEYILAGSKKERVTYDQPR